MGIIEIILIISIAGAFGGSLQGMVQMRIWNPEKEEPSGSPFLLLRGALFGIGGAMAIILILIWTDKFTYDKTVENQLFIISLSIVSGFIGYRILPKIALSIEDKIDRMIGTKVEQVKQEVKREVEKDFKEAEDTTEYNSVIVKAFTAIGEEGETSKTLAIEDLLKIRQRNEELLTDRKIHILLGRLYKGLKDYSNAIDILTEFIDTKREKGEDRDFDIAISLYNRACYKILKSTSIPEDDMDTKSTLNESALDDLELSFHIDPKLTTDAVKDPDLISIRYNTNLVRLTKKSI